MLPDIPVEPLWRDHKGLGKSTQSYKPEVGQNCSEGQLGPWQSLKQIQVDWIAKQPGIRESTLAAYLNSMGISTRRFGKGTSHLVSRKRLPGGVKCAYNNRVPGSISIMELTSHTCRFPLGTPDRPGFGYCGKHTNTLYCHARTHGGVF